MELIAKFLITVCLIIAIWLIVAVFRIWFDWTDIYRTVALFGISWVSMTIADCIVNHIKNKNDD